MKGTGDKLRSKAGAITSQSLLPFQKSLIPARGIESLIKQKRRNKSEEYHALEGASSHERSERKEVTKGQKDSSSPEQE